ncbi:MAG: MFS transporter [Pseudomonadota bacterium]
MNEFQEGWKPLLAATIGTMCGLFTITNYTQGFFVGPVISEFGWTPGQFFLSYTILMCAGLITAPIVGSLTQKYPLRTLGLVGLIGHALGYVVISLNPNSLLIWYASWALVAVVAAGSLPIIWTTVINGWFVKNRGKAIGITMAGTGLGAFLMPPVVEYFISNYGWRSAYRFIGMGPLFLAAPIVWFWFREKVQSAKHANTDNVPSGDSIKLSDDELSDGAGQREISDHTWGMTREQAMKSSKFWILGAVLFLTAFVIVGLLSNFERIVGAKQVDRETIASVAALIGISVVVGRLLVGALVDRFWAPAVAATFFVFPIIAIILLLSAPFTAVTGVMIAILIGLAAGAELDLLAYLTSKYFGPKHYAKVFGAIFAFFTVGAGLAPPVFGEFAVLMGGYQTALILGCFAFAISIGLFLALGQYPKEAMQEIDR